MTFSFSAVLRTYSLAMLALLSSALVWSSESGVTYRGVLPVIKFDVSPPLKNVTPLAVPRVDNRGGLMIDPDGGTDLEYGPQDFDPIVQSEVQARRIPAPSVSFDGPSNISNVSPPDPVGDIGPGHYVAMSNLFFQIYDRSGVSVFGPAANNTLWSGFGGACETENQGDPIVLYDQMADRWLLTQFTASGPEFFNCIALSTTADPTGTYFRWAISNGSNFPDYPKYGVGSDAYYISTRDFQGNTFAGIGAYALNRVEMLAGNPNPTIINFFVDRTVPSNVGDGILPMDIDGFTLPPANSPHYFVGTMDNGGPYSAPQDALTLWKFVADFSDPPSSSFTLSDTINTAPFDSIFPCPGGGRSCISQPGTTNMVDIQSYRQRPLYRLAYRNFGSHEALVTNQSVEAAAGIAGVRWWEIRSPNSSPTIFQEGTYAPGVNDGIHRWMGSIAMDSAGNIGLAYSASSSTVFPSLYYTGRLAADAAGMMAQGEASLFDGLGSQTSGQRWGDYSSLNVDPLDDCTFWYTNQYVLAGGGINWRLRIGSFRFDECGTPGFTLVSVSAASQSACADSSASYDLGLGSISGFSSPVTLVATGIPAPATASFSINPVLTLPGSTTLQTSLLTGVATGTYPLQVDGTAAGADPRSINLELRVFATPPTAATLLTPLDGAQNVGFLPSFSWSGTDSENYTIEVATDSGFSNIVFSQSLVATTVALGAALNSNSLYYWRVTADNACGAGSSSAIFSFMTQPAPGDCATGANRVVVDSYDFESGDQGWTHTALVGTDTWSLSSDNPHGGLQAFNVEDVITTSDQLLTSPEIVLPTGIAPLTLQFWNDQVLESRSATSCWDGGLLEVSTDGGSTFNQIVAPALLTDPYDGPLGGGPLIGQNAWCGDPQAYLNSIIDLDSLAGQNAIFRFRLSTDASVGRVQGWSIDDVAVLGCLAEGVFDDGFE